MMRDYNVWDPKHDRINFTIVAENQEDAKSTIAAILIQSHGYKGGHEAVKRRLRATRSCH